MKKDGNTFGPHATAVIKRHTLMGRPTYNPNCPISNEFDAARRKDEEIELLGKTKAKREEHFLSQCPPVMAKTSLDQVPNQESFKRVLEWQFGARGLILHGTSGRGKSRAAWAMLRKCYVEEGRQFCCLSSLAFSSQAIEAARNSTAERFVSGLAKVPILFLDDLGKSKITERVGEALYEVVDLRTLEELPIIITCNMVGEGLANRFDNQETGVAVIRRLREFCEIVAF